MILVVLLAPQLCLGLVPAQTRFMERLWGAQTPSSPHSSVVIEDESLKPVMMEICEHLQFCEAEGFGSGGASRVLAASGGHVGQQLVFSGGSDSSMKMPYGGEDEDTVLRETMLWCRAMISHHFPNA